MNHVPFTCEGKKTLDHQEENKGQTVAVVVVSDNMIFSLPAEKPGKCLCPNLSHLLTLEPTVRRDLVVTRAIFSKALTTQQPIWGSGQQGDPNRAHFTVTRPAIPAFVLGREKQDAGYSESEFQGKTLSEEAVKAFLIASFLSQNRKSEPSGYGHWIWHTPFFFFFFLWVVSLLLLFFFF